MRMLTCTRADPLKTLVRCADVFQADDELDEGETSG